MTYEKMIKMMTVISYIFVIVSTILLAYSVSAQPLESNQIAVAVVIEKGVDITGVQFDLLYDSKKVKFSAYEIGEFIKRDDGNILSVPVIDTSREGIISDVVFARTGSNAGVSGEGAIALFTFNVTDPSVKTFDVSVQNALLANSKGERAEGVLSTKMFTYEEAVKQEDPSFFDNLFNSLIGAINFEEFEFDNRKVTSLDPDAKYETIKIRNLFGIGTELAEYKLLKNYDSILDTYAEGTVKINTPDKMIAEMNFLGKSGQHVDFQTTTYINYTENYDTQVPVFKEVCKFDDKNATEFCHNETERYITVIKQREGWKIYNGEILDKGEYRWKIEGKKNRIGQQVDWVITAYGNELNEWAWWDSTWARRKPLNITGGSVNMTNFTVYVNVSYDSDMQSDFDDIRFVDGSCLGAQSTELKYETDWVVNSSSAGFWVRIPTLATGTNQVCMYYNAPAVSSASDGVNAWDPNYTIIMHLSENSGTKLKNSKNGNTTFMNMSIGGNWIDGVFGRAINFTSSQYGRSYASTLILTDQLTVEEWVNARGISQDRTHFNIMTGRGSTNYGFASGQSGTGGNAFFKGCFMGTSAWNSNKNWNDVLNAWYMGQCTSQNGVASATIALQNKTAFTSEQGGGSGGTLAGTEGDWALGYYEGATKYGESYYDEIRYSNVQRSSAWLNRSYDNINMALFAFGNEEINTGISIDLNSPANNVVIGSNFTTLTWNVTGLGNTTLVNSTLKVYNTSNFLVFNFTNSAILGLVQANISQATNNLSEGTYNWAAYVLGNGNETADSSNRTFVLDYTPPSVSITTPQNNSIYVTTTFPVNISFLSNVSDPHLQTCLFYTSDNSTNTTVTCNTTYNGAMFFTEGTKTITLSANDTVGGNARATNNFSIIFYNYTTFESVDPIGEGGLSVFNLTVNMTNIPTTVASFLYNSVAYTPTSQTSTQNSTTFGYSLVIPSGYGNSTGKLQFWNWSFNITGIANVTTTTQNQTVFSVSITNCTAGGVVFMNFTMRDEASRSLYSVTNLTPNNMQVDLRLSSLLDNSIYWNFNTTKVNSTNLIVCVPTGLLNSTSYKLDLTGSYVGTNYVQEFFYIDNGTVSITNIPQLFDWFDLLTADSTSFLFSFEDANGLTPDNIIVHTLRYYIGDGVFKEVERSKEDNNGETILHLVEEDVIYKFNITQFGQQIFLSSQYNAKCLQTPCSITLSASEGSPQLPAQDQWDNLPSGSYSVITNKTTRQVTLLFNLNSSSLMNLTVYQDNGNNETLVASGSTTASGGSITVNVPVSYGNSTYFAVVWHDNDFVSTQWVDLTETGRDYFGTTGLFLALIAVITLIAIGASQGEFVIVWAVLAIIFVGIMKWLDYNFLSLMTFVCICALLMWKLAARRRVA